MPSTKPKKSMTNDGKKKKNTVGKQKSALLRYLWLLYIVLLREHKVPVLLWRAHYPTRSGNLLVIMDCWSFADLLVLMLQPVGWCGERAFDLKVYYWQLPCRVVFWSCWYWGLHQWKGQTLLGDVFRWRGLTQLGSVEAEKILPILTL